MPGRSRQFAVVVSLALTAAFALPSVGAAQEADAFRAHIRHGLQFVRTGEYDRAVEAYEEALVVAADDVQRAEALLGRAAALRLARRDTESLQTYRRAAELPEATDYQRTEAWRGVVRAAVSLQDEAAELEAQQRLAQCPGLSEAERAMALGRVGELWLSQGQENKALVQFRELLEQFPQQPGAVLARRRLLEYYAVRRDEVQVDQILAQAREQNLPDADALHIIAAEAAARADDVKRGLAILEELLRIRPYSAVAWQRAWELHEEAGDEEEFLQRVMERAAGDVAVAAGLAAVAETLAARGEPGDLQKALSIYETLQKTRPGDPGVLSSAAQTALAAENLALADRWSTQALEAQPRDLQAQSVRARVLVRMGEDERALELLKQVASFRPEDLNSAQRLASLLRTARLEKFLPVVAEQVRQATGQRSALTSQLAFYYQQCGQWPQALEELATATDSGEVSDSYSSMTLRAWLNEATARAEVLAALEDRRKADKLPEAFIGPYVYGMLLEGRREQALAELQVLPQQARATTTLEIIQWLGLAGRSDLTRALYEIVLTGPLEPETNTRIALTVAGDLAAAGRLGEAVKVLEEHRKPGMPEALARAYDLELARALLALGEVGRAEVLAQRLAERRGDPDSAAVIVVLAECALRRGDFATTRELVGRLLATGSAPADMAEIETPPPPPDLGQGSASVVVMAPRAPDLLREGPNEVRGCALLLLAEALLREGKFDLAREGFERVVAETPATAAATQAVQRLMTVADLEQVEEAARQRFIEGLCALDRGDTEAARGFLGEGFNDYDDPLDDDARLLMAEALAPCNPQEAARQMEALAQTLPQSPVAPYALLRAVELSAPTAPAEAVRLAQALQDRFPESALVPLAARLQEDLRRTAQ